MGSPNFHSCLWFYCFLESNIEESISLKNRPLALLCLEQKQKKCKNYCPNNAIGYDIAVILRKVFFPPSIFFHHSSLFLQIEMLEPLALWKRKITLLKRKGGLSPFLEFQTVVEPLKGRQRALERKHHEFDQSFPVPPRNLEQRTGAQSWSWWWMEIVGREILIVWQRWIARREWPSAWLLKWSPQERAKCILSGNWE